jgi:hypothetical protein
MADAREQLGLRLKGSRVSAFEQSWQHFQERSVVCSPEQSERAGENTVPLSCDALTALG